MDTKKLDAIRAKLRALREKTVENGCTEEEAMAAAEKMTEMLAKHGLSAEELEDEGYDQNTLPMGRRSPLERVWFGVARFSDCKAWFSRSWDGKLSIVFFGRPQDVLVAEYVYGVLKDACKRALADFRASEPYTRRRTTKTRAQAVKAFQEGLAAGLCRKLLDGLWRRYWTGQSETTNALIASAKNQLNIAAHDAGIKFGKPARPLKDAKGMFADDAQRHGNRAADAISVNAAIATSGAKIGGLLG